MVTVPRHQVGVAPAQTTPERNQVPLGEGASFVSADPQTRAIRCDRLRNGRSPLQALPAPMRPAPDERRRKVGQVLPSFDSKTLLELWSERKSQVALIRAEDEFKQVFLAVVDDLDDARAIGAQRLPKEVGRTARHRTKGWHRSSRDA